MAQRVGKVALVMVIFLLVTALPYRLFAQSKAPTSVDELLKSIGLTKPAVSRAPDFNLRDANGGTASLTAYRGSLVLLNFWATWCGPCREEMPSMDQLSRNFGGQGLVVVAVNQRENAAQVSRFMKTNRLNFSTPLDTDGRVAASYRVYGIPATYLIDGSGQPIGMKSGPMDWAGSDVVNVFRKLTTGAASSTVGGALNLEPAVPMPNTLRAKANGISVHVQQDPYSEAVGRLERGEELAPLGKVSGAGEFWYMIRTKNGAVGWVKGSDVEEVRMAK